MPDQLCDPEDVPIWAFHGAKDEAAPLWAEQELVEAQQACRSSARLTVYPDLGHDIDQTYEDPDPWTRLWSQWLE